MLFGGVDGGRLSASGEEIQWQVEKEQDETESLWPGGGEGE